MQATTGVLSRRMKHVNVTVLVFWNSIFGLVIALLVIVVQGFVGDNGFRVYTARQYGMITATGLVDFIALTSSTIAF